MEIKRSFKKVYAYYKKATFRQLFVSFLIAFDRGRRYLGIATAIIGFAVFVKLFKLEPQWYFLIIPILFFGVLVMGILDTVLGIREEEINNNNKQNKLFMDVVKNLNNTIKTRPIEQKIESIKKDISLHDYPYLYTLYQAVMVIRPKLIIDWGTKTGVTAIVMALALENIGKGRVYSYDVFDKDAKNKVAGPFSQEKAEGNIKKYGLQDIIAVEQKDFWEWIKHPVLCDIIYIDIDNDGDKILALYEGAKHSNLVKYILFEGGTYERDQVKWMVDLNRHPINSIKEEVGYTVIDERFPSLSLIKL